MLKNEIQDAAELPVLPPGVTHLLHVLNDEHIPFDEITKEIERFPSISLRILAIANSAWAAPICPIVSLLDACTRLGFQIVRSVAIALSVADVFDPARCQAFDAKRFWLSALLDAEAAQLCARGREDISVDIARTAGLLKNVGLLWLAYNKPIETGDAILRSNNCENMTLTEALHASLKIDHHVAGSLLAEAMELPVALIEAIGSEAITGECQNPLLIENTIRAHRISEMLLNAESGEEAVTDPDICEDEVYQKLAARFADIEAMAEMVFNS